MIKKSDLLERMKTLKSLKHDFIDMESEFISYEREFPSLIKSIRTRKDALWRLEYYSAQYNTLKKYTQMNNYDEKSQSSAINGWYNFSNLTDPVDRQYAINSAMESLIKDAQKHMSEVNRGEIELRKKKVTMKPKRKSVKTYVDKYNRKF